MTTVTVDRDVLDQAIKNMRDATQVIDHLNDLLEQLYAECKKLRAENLLLRTQAHGPH